MPPEFSGKLEREMFQWKRSMLTLGSQDPCALLHVKKILTSATRARLPSVSYKNWRSRARDLSSDTSLELAALIPNFALLKVSFFRI